jgi:nucleoside 2-deoxyribosyltransferase
MRIYLAAPFECKSRIIKLASFLEDKGIIVNASWLNSPVAVNINPATQMADILVDCAEIRICDLFVLYNPEEYRKSGTGGRHVETGYAYALGKRILIVGERTNLFHHPDLMLCISEKDDEIIYQTIRNSMFGR